MKKGLLLFALSFFAISLFAQTIVSTSSENKNVVLEEFTGIHCGYCPDGHAIAQAIQDNNLGDVFLINIHTGGYATPSSGEPDFRTDFGDAIAGQSGLTGYPAGTVNRHFFSGYSQGSGTAQGRGDWTSTSAIIQGEGSYVNVAVEAEVNINTRELTVHVEAYYTGDSPESTNLLNVALLQNNTFGPQSSGGAGDNYNHMHRLVYMITGQWGEEISTTTTGTFVDRTYTYTLPTDYREVEVMMNNLEIVAFVSETHQEIESGNGCIPNLIGLDNDNDISLINVNVPDMICDGELTPNLTITNVGNNNVTALEITYQINSETPQMYNWTGNMGTLNSETIELPMLSFISQPINTLIVTIESDDNQDNNSITEEVGGAIEGITYIELLFETGVNANEFSWKLRNSNNDVIGSGSNYEDNETISEKFELPEDCYKLEFFDNGEDGGTTVTIKDAYTELYYINGNWGADEVARFKTVITEVNEATIPTSGSTGASISSNIYIDFNQPVRYLNNSSISTMHSDLPVTFTTNDKTNIPFTLFMNGDKTKLTISPNDNLDFLTEYTIILSGGVIENYYDIEIIDDITFTFTTENETSIVENNNEINIFPNPAKDLLNIENAENAEIQIYNIIGELIISTKQTSIDVSALSTGTYIVKVISENNTTTQKVNISN